MASFAQMKSSVLACGVKLGAGILLLLGDRALASIAGMLAALCWNGEAKAALREVAEVLRLGPPGTTLVRRMVAESRLEELADLIWGSLYLRRPDIEV
jgi:hypothetical protein